MGTALSGNGPKWERAQVTCDFTNCQRFAEFSVGLFGKDQHAFPNERGDECSRGCAPA